MLRHGVPQGSILELFCFLLYTMDITGLWTEPDSVVTCMRINVTRPLSPVMSTRTRNTNIFWYLEIQKSLRILVFLVRFIYHCLPNCAGHKLIQGVLSLGFNVCR